MRNTYLPLIMGGVMAGACLKYIAAPPNIELLMPFVMVAGMLTGRTRGFMAGFSMRMMYDFYLAMPGPWTIYTSLAYGIVGLIASTIPIRENRLGLTIWAAGLTVLYDIITMVCFGLSFGLPVFSLIGPQLPFTAMHLAGNCVFVFALAPGLRTLVQKLENGEPILNVPGIHLRR